MTFLKAFFFISGVFLLAGCGPAQQGTQAPGDFFDTEAFVKKQREWLETEKPVVVKELQMEGKEDRRETREIDWEKELELFTQANLNKPAFRDSYTVTRSDSGVFYKVKAGESLPVRFLRVKLVPGTGRVEAIEAELYTENKLYESQKHISLACTSGPGETRIRSYAIEGFQKLSVSAKKPFAVRGTILSQ